MFDFFRSKKDKTIKCVSGCGHATRPRGGHCNFQRVLLLPFKPKFLAKDNYEVKDFLLTNPHGAHLTKISTVFPEYWSPMECTEKVLHILSSENKKIIPMNRFGFLKIVGYTEENIEIIIFHDIKKSKLALFYPNFQEETL